MTRGKSHWSNTGSQGPSRSDANPNVAHGFTSRTRRIIKPEYLAKFCASPRRSAADLSPVIAPTPRIGELLATLERRLGLTNNTLVVFSPPTMGGKHGPADRRMGRTNPPGPDSELGVRGRHRRVPAANAPCCRAASAFRFSPAGRKDCRRQNRLIGKPDFPGSDPGGV